MNNDQVSYTFGMKLNTRQYENATFTVSLRSDVKDGETLDQAFKRVKDWVEERAERDLVNIRAVYSGDKSSDSEWSNNR